MPVTKYFISETEEQIEKYKQSLQIYLQMLGRNTVLKYDLSLKVFLTCENQEEFAKWKNEHKQEINKGMFNIEMRNGANFNDALDFICNSLKTRFFTKLEPEEIKIGGKLDDNLRKIIQYLPFLDKNIKLIEEKDEFENNYSISEEALVESISKIDCEDINLGKTFKAIIDFHIKRAAALRVCILIVIGNLKIKYKVDLYI